MSVEFYPLRPASIAPSERLWHNARSRGDSFKLESRAQQRPEHCMPIGALNTQRRALPIPKWSRALALLSCHGWHGRIREV